MSIFKTSVISQDENMQWYIQSDTCISKLTILKLSVAAMQLEAGNIETAFLTMISQGLEKEH